MKTNKLPIHRGESFPEDFVKPRGLSQNAGAGVWLIFQTVGLFLVLTLHAYGEGKADEEALLKSNPTAYWAAKDKAEREAKWERDFGGPDAQQKEAEAQLSAARSQRNNLTFTNNSGVVYSNVTVVKVKPDSLSFLFNDGSGGGTIKLATLPEFLQARFGYDAQKAAAYETAQAQIKARQAALEAEQAWRRQQEAQRLAELRAAEARRQAELRAAAAQAARERWIADAPRREAEEQTRILRNQSREAEEQTRILREQARMLEENNRMLDEMKRDAFRRKLWGK